MKLYQCSIACPLEPLELPEDQEVVELAAHIAARTEGFLRDGEIFPEGSSFTLSLLPGLITMYSILVQIPEESDLKFNNLLEGVNLDGV